MSDSQATRPDIEINLPKLLEFGSSTIHRMFFQQKPEAAKKVFKRLKSGESIRIGELTHSPDKNLLGEATGESVKFPLKMELEYSEFRGPGFGFPVFHTALGAMMNSLNKAMREQSDLNILSNKRTGGALVHYPGAVQMKGHLNVMLLAIEPARANTLVFRFLFVDPSQYETKEAAIARQLKGESSADESAAGEPSD